MLEVDQEHLARLQPPFGDDLIFRDRQHPHLGRHDDAAVAGDDVARRAQAVPVERGADLPAVGEGDRRRAVPWLHQRGVVFVEGATLLVHQRITRPRFRDHHHHRMGERVAAHGEEFQGVVEAGGVRLAFIGDRPQLLDIGAELRRRHRGLPGGHPVVVAAQRVDLAVMGDHAVRVRQRPGRESVGGEALMHQGQRALEIRIAQIRVIGDKLVGEEHPLVDHGAAGDRHRIIVRGAPLAFAVHYAGDGLAQNVEPALEFLLRPRVRIAGEENLLVHRLGRLDRFAERRIVGRHVAPAEQRHAFARCDLRVNVHDLAPPAGVVRQKQHADRVVTGRRQFEAEFGGLLDKEFVRRLHQNAGAVAGARIGADRAAVLEVEQDGERVFDDLVRRAALDIGNETDSAGIFFQRRIEQAELRSAHRYSFFPRRCRAGLKVHPSSRRLLLPFLSRGKGKSCARGRAIHTGGNRGAAWPPWLLYAAVRRALVLGGWPPRIFPRTPACSACAETAARSARSGHQLGQ